jgi:hypothetical protein
LREKGSEHEIEFGKTQKDELLYHSQIIDNLCQLRVNAIPVLFYDFAVQVHYWIHHIAIALSCRSPSGFAFEVAHPLF